MQHEFQWTHPTTGKHVTLNYDAIHLAEENLVNIDRELPIVRIDCSEKNGGGNGTDEITLFLFTSPDAEVSAARAADALAERLGDDSFLTGRPEWGCTPHSASGRADQAPEVILRRVVGSPVVSYDIDGGATATITLSTAPAGYSDFFHKADINFLFSAVPEGFATQYDAPTRFDPEAAGAGPVPQHIIPSMRDQQALRGARRRLGFFSWIGGVVNTVWKKVKTIAKDVEKAVDFVEKHW